MVVCPLGRLPGAASVAALVCLPGAACVAACRRAYRPAAGDSGRDRDERECASGPNTGRISTTACHMAQPAVVF